MTSHGRHSTEGIKHHHITGLIVDGAGHHLGGVHVTAVNAPASTDAPPDPCCSKEDGKFTLEVAPGQAVLVQFAAQHQHEGKILFGPKLPIYCQPKDRTDLGKIVYKCMNVIGTVVQANGDAPPTPIANAPLELYDSCGNCVAKANADELGNFAFVRPEPGIYSVSVAADWLASQGHTLAPSPISAFHLGEDDQFSHPAIHLDQTAFTITGALMAGAEPIVGVPVSIEGIAGSQFTDQCGSFSFKDLSRASYTIVFPSPVMDVRNVSWEIVPGEPFKSIATPTGQGPQITATVPKYRREVHQVEVLLLRPDGSPAGDILVELLTSSGKNSLDRQRTNKAGVVRLNPPQAGEFLLRAFGENTAPSESYVACHSESRMTMVLAGPAPAESLVDLTAYPLLTEDVSQGGGPPVSRTGADGSVGNTASAAISSVLGWRSKTDDPTGFLAAITNAFELKDVEGHVEWTRVSSTSVVSVNADMGAITGAQASILRRAQTMMAEACRILPTIQALRPDADPVDCASILSIVVDELGQIPDALSLPNGPIVERVDEIFRLLGASTAAEATVPLEGLTGQLQEFRDRYGLMRYWVNTLTQEQTYTDFITVVDYITDIYKSWQMNRGFFSGMGGEPPFLGMSLIRISQLLSVIADKVNQVRYVMESLFIPRSELGTIQMNFGGDHAPMYFEDLLNWIERSSIDAATQMRLNGKDAVITYAKSAKLLFKLINKCYYNNQKSFGNADIPKAFAAPRASRAIKELADQLDEIHQQAQKVNRKPDPQVRTVIPVPAHGMHPVTSIQLYGAYFQNNAKVLITPKDAPSSTPVPLTTNWINSTFMTAVLHSPIQPPPQPTTRWRITVLNPDGGTWESNPGEEITGL